MAISTTRVKFLDKENKVLVKPIKDFISNEIFSDFITSFLDTDLVSSFVGQQNLLVLQGSLGSLTSLLGDATISNFSVDKLLKDLDFTSPALAHLAPTMTAIKSMDEKTVNLFVSSLLEVTTDKLIDNPSLVNMYLTVTPDVKAQTLLSAISVFSSKLTSGQITVAGFTSQLKDSAGTDFDLTKVTTLLNAVKSNTRAIDLAAIIPGSAELSKSFLEGLTALEVKEEKIAAGTAGAVTTVTPIVVGSPTVIPGVDVGVTSVVSTVGGVTGTTYVAVTTAKTDTSVTDLITGKTTPSITNVQLAPDPIIPILRRVYLGIKRECVLAHLRLLFRIYTGFTWLDHVQTPKGKQLLTEKLTGDVKVAPAEQADIFMQMLSSLLFGVRRNAESATPVTETVLTEVFTTISNAISSVLESLLSETKSKIDTSFAVAPAIIQAVSYINNPAYTATPSIEFAGFTRGEVFNNLVAHINALTNERIASSASGGIVDKEVAGGIIAYTNLQIVGYLLSVTNINLKSYYSFVNVTQDLSSSIYGFKVGAALAAVGYATGSSLITYSAPQTYVTMIPKFYAGVYKSIAITASPTSQASVDVENCRDLRSFIATLASIIGETATGSPVPGRELNSYPILLQLYDIYKRSSLDIDKPVYAKEAVSLDQVAFSADSSSVIIT